MKDLRFFLALARPDRWWLRLGAVLAAITLLAGIGLLSLSGWFITAAAIAGLAGAGRSFNYLFASGGVRAFALTRTAGRYAERMATHEATFRILARLRLWVFDAAAPLAPAKLGAMRGGDLLSRVTQDVDALDSLYLRLVTPVFAAVCGALFAIAILAFTAPLAIPGVIGVFLLASLVLPLIAARAGARPGAAIAEASSDARAEAGDLVAGLAELKAYGADARVAARLAAASDRWIAGQRSLSRLALINGGVLAFSGPAAFAAGFSLALAGGASAPVAALAGFIGFALFEAAAPLVQAAELYGRTTASARRLKALAEIVPAVTAPDGPAPLPGRWDVTVRDVRFAYPGKDGPALDGLSLDLPEGGRLALVGASGSGKSTLIRLLMRFYAADEGLIEIGGSDIACHAPADTRARFALVDQRAELLSATVADNLRLARAEATEAELWAALELAGAKAFVQALPEGLDTWIGEQGGLVSGGQARRIALARAFVKDAPILLLDEPTEGLDEATEAAFLDALDVWLDADPRRSVLIVTHRAKLLERARQAVVIEDGRAVETGAPGTLAGQNGVFARLFPAFTG
ncbi:thiol reductant ABC exporter subunit CydC [Glycocaulis profundi]|nr:thiol reductant ABC exporter subunit CydC [Glycocaulis profundi]